MDMTDTFNVYLKWVSYALLTDTAGNLFRNLVEVNVTFVNTSIAGKSEVEVRFILKQSATIDIICLMNLSGEC